MEGNSSFHLIVYKLSYMASITLDIAVVPGSPDWKTEVSDILEPLQLTHEIINHSGPGGGWPIVDISGTVENIKKYLLIYCGDDEEQAEEFYDDIEE